MSDTALRSAAGGGRLDARLADLDRRAAEAAGPLGSPVWHRTEEHARLLERAGRWVEAASAYGALAARCSGARSLALQADATRCYDEARAMAPRYRCPTCGEERISPQEGPACDSCAREGRWVRMERVQ